MGRRSIACGLLICAVLLLSGCKKGGGGGGKGQQKGQNEQKGQKGQNPQKGQTGKAPSSKAPPTTKKTAPSFGEEDSGHAQFLNGTTNGIEAELRKLKEELGDPNFNRLATAYRNGESPDALKKLAKSLSEQGDPSAMQKIAASSPAPSPLPRPPPATSKKLDLLVWKPFVVPTFLPAGHRPRSVELQE